MCTRRSRSSSSLSSWLDASISSRWASSCSAVISGIACFLACGVQHDDRRSAPSCTSPILGILGGESGLAPRETAELAQERRDVDVVVADLQRLAPDAGGAVAGLRRAAGPPPGGAAGGGAGGGGAGGGGAPGPPAA